MTFLPQHGFAARWTGAAEARVWSRSRLAVAALLVSIAYLAAAEVGIRLTFRPQPVSTLWMPNAVVLAACLVVPVRYWWVLLLAVIPPHFGVELLAGVPPLMVLCWFISNSVEAVLGAGLLRWWVGHPLRLDSYRSVALFIVAAAVGPALSSFLDAAFVGMNGWGESGYWAVWRSRFASNSLATLIVVPVVLAWAGARASQLRRVPLRRVVEAVLLVAGLVGASLAAFNGEAGEANHTPEILYAPIPFLVWAAIRFGPCGSSTSLLVVVLLTVWGAVNDRGPFVERSAHENALTMQLLFTSFSITLLFVTARIEERRRALETARLRNEQLRLALDAAQMGMWDFRIAEGTLELSEEAEEILGIPARGAVGTLDQFLEVVHPADRVSLSAAVARSVRLGEPSEFEFRLNDATAGDRWVRCKGQPLPDDRGRPGRVVGLCTDITSRKRQEAASARQHRILEMIAVGAPFQATLDALADLIEIESPGTLCSILLVDADGVHIRHGSAPSLPEEYTRAIDGCAISPDSGSCGRAMALRTRIVTVDILEDPVWEDFRELTSRQGLRSCCSSPIISDQGRVLGCIGVYRREPRRPSQEEIRVIDFATHIAAIVVERKRTETESLEQRSALAHLSRVVMLGEVSGMLAHELNQPLTAILSNAEAALRLLRGKKALPDEILPMVESIVAADYRACEVIHRLRATMKKGTAELAPVDFNAVVTSTIELARGDLAARGVEVDTVLAPQLPAVLGDRIQLQQVVLNLLTNACDAMSSTSAAERRVIVETRLAAAGDMVELSVTDHGTGIPEDVLGRIFEPFFTLKEHGLGLGLPICKSIVLAHRGRLLAENAPGRGATFRMLLPTRTGAAPQAARRASARASWADARVPPPN